MAQHIGGYRSGVTQKRLAVVKISSFPLLMAKQQSIYGWPVEPVEPVKTVKMGRC